MPIAFRVMTFNVLYGTYPHYNRGTSYPKWPARREVVREVLEKMDPDVFGTQECTAEQLRDLGELLPQYRYVGAPSGRNPSKLLYGVYPDIHNAVFYKHERFRLLDHGDFWQSETPEEPSKWRSKEGRSRMVTWLHLAFPHTEAHLLLFNTQLDWGLTPYWEGYRMKGIELIADRAQSYGPATPVLITGDLNCSRESMAIDRLREAGFRDAWSATGYDADHGTVHDGAGNPGEKRDWIFFRGDLHANNAQVVTYSSRGLYPSDHFPVTAVFHLPD